MLGNLHPCLLPILFLAVDYEPDLVSNFPALGSASSYSERLCIGPQGKKSFWMEEPRADMLGKLSQNYMRPIFPSVQTAKPDWEAIMWDFSVDTWLWILRVMQKNSVMISL